MVRLFDEVTRIMLILQVWYGNLICLIIAATSIAMRYMPPLHTYCLYMCVYACLATVCWQIVAAVVSCTIAKSNKFSKHTHTAANIMHNTYVCKWCCSLKCVCINALAAGNMFFTRRCYIAICMHAATCCHKVHYFIQIVVYACVLATYFNCHS